LATFELCASTAQSYYDSLWCTYREPSDCVRFTLDRRAKTSSAAAPPATVEKAPAALRFRVTFPEDPYALKLTYQDTARGDLVRTSQAAAGQLFSLSEVQRFSPTEARCALRDGALTVVRPRLPPNQPETHR
jgi:hypothetical protein